MLMASSGGGCATAACAAAVTRRWPAPKPAPKPCSWLSLCGLHQGRGQGEAFKAVVATGKKIATRTIAAVKKLPVIGRVVKVAISAISDAYRAAVTYATRDRAARSPGPRPGWAQSPSTW